MGTHPIFESDFDCLTDMPVIHTRGGDDRRKASSYRRAFGGKSLSYYDRAKSMTDLSGVGSMMNGDVSGTNLFVGDGFFDDGYCASDVGDRSKILMTEIITFYSKIG